MTQLGSATRPAVDFDHHRPVAEVDPDATYAELRERCPVAWTESHGGYWVITKHEHVAQVLKDFKSFSSAKNEVVPDGTPFNIPPYPMGLYIPEELDPPEFHKYRRLFNGMLSPKHIERMQERIAHWVTYYIDRVIERGECDLVYDLASPVPGAVTLEWVGFPQEDWERISFAFHDVVGYPPGHERSVRAYADLAWLDRRITELVADRRANPRAGDDVVTYLVEAEVDGEPISDEYIEGMLRIIIGGGVDTTTSLMGSTLVHLSRNPRQRQQLIDDPGLWQTATEEFLRRYPPVRTHARTAIRDVEVGGCLIRAGDRVLASEGSACHDGDAFPDPREVILDRFPNRHVAFGLGIHRCAGMHLARAEFRELMTQVLERMPDYRVREDELVRFHIEPQIAGWSTIPADFTPGPRRLA